jgi:hypothetical protein
MAIAGGPNAQAALRALRKFANRNTGHAVNDIIDYIDSKAELIDEGVRLRVFLQQSDTNPASGV